LLDRIRAERHDTTPGHRSAWPPRWPCSPPPWCGVRMIHRECGVLKTTYEADMAFYPLPIARWTVAALAVVFFLVIPLTLHEYFLSVGNLVWIAVIGALGLNILVGYTGQVSIGHGAFMSVGAYTAANLATRLGSPWPVNLLAGGLMAALVGAVVGIPSLRIKGLYLAIATLAGQVIIEWTINHVTFISGGVQASIEVPRPRLGSMVLASQRDMYYFLLFFVTLAVVGAMNLVRSRVGRAFIAIRDQDIAPETVLNLIPNLRLMLFGALIIFFLIVEPEGLNRLWRNIRNYFRIWPFAY